MLILFRFFQIHKLLYSLLCFVFLFSACSVNNSNEESNSSVSSDSKSDLESGSQSLTEKHNQNLEITVDSSFNSSKKVKSIVEKEYRFFKLGSRGFIRAMFIDASFGDLMHYEFKLEDSSYASFDRNDDQELRIVQDCDQVFTEDISDGQGLCQNSSLIGKWFDIEYVGEKTEGEIAMYVDSVWVMKELTPVKDLENHLKASDEELLLQIVKQFDLNTIRSSYGPRVDKSRKYLKDQHEVNAFSIKGNKMTIEDSTWRYEFVVLERGDFNRDGFNDVKIKFTDEAKQGSYFVISDLVFTKMDVSLDIVAISDENITVN